MKTISDGVMCATTQPMHRMHIPLPSARGGAVKRLTTAYVASSYLSCPLQTLAIAANFPVVPQCAWGTGEHNLLWRSLHAQNSHLPPTDRLGADLELP